uniref:Pepsin-I3 domain-containing protein n=1 Tax=Angiostrongylus cantonensis TaxID=6313 RepID=A0A0K0CUN0_ANGCA
MKLLFVCALIAITAAAPRQKRPTVATIAVSGVGSSTGCVNTGNVLFANGFKLRDTNRTAGTAKLSEPDGRIRR